VFRDSELSYNAVFGNNRSSCHCRYREADISVLIDSLMSHLAILQQLNRQDEFQLDFATSESNDSLTRVLL